MYKPILLILLSTLIPSASQAVTPTQIFPRQMYLAGYCFELARTELKSSDRKRDETIRLIAAELIMGGDNLEYLEIGITDARRKVLGQSWPTLSIDPNFPSSNLTVSEELTNCRGELTDLIISFEWPLCGHGTNRDNPSILPMLTKLGLSTEAQMAELVVLPRYIKSIERDVEPDLLTGPPIELTELKAKAEQLIEADRARNETWLVKLTNWFYQTALM